MTRIRDEEPSGLVSGRTNPVRGQARMAAMNTTREAAAALSGLLAGAVALGVAELTAAVTGARGAPVLAVGEAAINLTPVPVKEFAITHFGTHDKLALVSGILVLLAGFAAVIGLLAARRPALGLAGLGAFAAVGVTAVTSLPGTTAVDVVPTLVGAAVAVAALYALVHAMQMVWKEPPGVTVQPTGRDRRRRLISGAGAAVVAAGAGGLGAALLGRSGAAPGQVRLPAPALRAARVPAGADLRIAGLTPF